MLPLVKAKYRARVCGGASFQDSKNGNMQVALPFEITQGEHAGEGITWIGIMHGTADKNGQTGEERVIASLQYAGWQGDDLSELAGITDERAKELMPEEVELTCDVDTYEGKQRLKVQWVNKAGGGRFAFKDQLEGGNLKLFAAKLKNTVKAVRQQNGAPRTAPANGASGGGSKRDDDLPFASCSLDHEPMLKVFR